MVVVAQLVELRFVVPAVVGSSPINHPKIMKWTHCVYVLRRSIQVL